MEFISAISLGFKVIGLVDTVIGSFQVIQNAPRELQDFRRSVVRLHRHVELLQASDGGSLKSLSGDDIEAIQITLKDCEDLLQQHVDLQRRGMVNGVLRGVWSIRNNQNLVKFKDRIDSHYSQIVIPRMLESISARIPAINDPPPLERDHASTIETSSLKSGAPVPQKQLEAISDRLRTLDNTKPGVIEQQLCTIDYELQTCWADLGLWDERVIKQPNPTSFRRSSINFEHAPTTLILSNVPYPHKEIKLERLHIMARDDESRILQYQNLDATIHVTHIVPFGSIPWTETTKPKQVSFLKPHMITVIDKTGHHIYKLDPKYKFKKQESCEQFQSTLRERAFCGTFEAVEVKMGGTIVACRQMIRFWQRGGPSTGQINTMTFLLSSVDTGRPGCHEEVDLSRLESKAEYRSSWRLGKRSQKIIIKSIKHGTSQLRIKFDTEEDAKGFKTRYEAVRAGQHHFARIGSFSTASISTAKTPTEQLHDWTSMMTIINNPDTIDNT